MIPLLLTLVVYYVSVLLFGLLGIRQQTPAAYISAPNSTHFIWLTLTLVATVVGGGMFLGVAQLAFDQGLPAFCLGIAYLLGSAVLGSLAPHIRKYARDHNVTTLFGVIETIYPSEKYFSVSNLFGWITFVVFFLMLAAQFVAIGTYLSFYIGLHFQLAIMIGAAVVAVISTLLYASLGGFTRDVFTDIVQMAFIFLGVAVLLYALSQRDFQLTMHQLSSHLFTVNHSNVIFLFGSLLFVTLTFIVRFDLWQRIITARTDLQAKAAFFTSGVLNFIFFVIFGILGLYGKAVGASESRFVGLDVIQRITTGVSNGLVIAAFFAAVMSSADTFLGVAGLALAKASVYRKRELELSGDSSVSISTLRRFTLIVGLVSIVIAILIRDIIDIFAFSFGVLLIFLPSFVGGFLRKKPKEVECYWSIGIGLLVMVPLTFITPKEAYLPGLLFSVGAYWLAVKLTKNAIPQSMAAK